MTLRLVQKDQVSEEEKASYSDSTWELGSLVEVEVEVEAEVENEPPPPLEPPIEKNPEPVKAEHVTAMADVTVAKQTEQVQAVSNDEALAVEKEPMPMAPLAATASSPQGLSLAELGIGGINPFLLAPGGAESGPGGGTKVAGMPAAVRKDSAYHAHARLQRSLSLGALQQDQELGLGPEGPVVAALTDITYEAAETAADGDAQIRVVTNAQGQVVDVRLLSASGNTAAWQRIVAELLKRMGKQELRVAGRAVTLDFHVKSRNQLPSGRSPGVAVRAFGKNLKKGEGPNSSAIAILEPGLQEVPLYNSPDAPTVKVPSLVLLGVNADLADIGAAARRVVHVTLERMSVN